MLLFLFKIILIIGNLVIYNIVMHLFHFFSKDEPKADTDNWGIAAIIICIVGCFIIPFVIGVKQYSDLAFISFALTLGMASFSFGLKFKKGYDKNAPKRSEKKEMDSKKKIEIIMNKIMAKNHEIITSKKDFKIVKNIVSNNFIKNREFSFPDKNSLKEQIAKLEEKNNSLEIDTYTEYIESLKDAIEFMDSKFVELQSKTDEIFNTNKNKDLVVRFSFIHTLMEKNSKIINDLCKKIPSLQKVIDDIDKSMNAFIIESDKLKIDMEFSDFNNSNQENPYYSQLQTDLSSTSEKIAEFNKAIKEIYTM